MINWLIANVDFWPSPLPFHVPQHAFKNCWSPDKCTIKWFWKFCELVHWTVWRPEKKQSDDKEETAHKWCCIQYPVPVKDVIILEDALTLSHVPLNHFGKPGYWISLHKKKVTTNYIFPVKLALRSHFQAWYNKTIFNLFQYCYPRCYLHPT